MYCSTLLDYNTLTYNNIYIIVCNHVFVLGRIVILVYAPVTRVTRVQFPAREVFSEILVPVSRLHLHCVSFLNDDVSLLNISYKIH